MGGIGAIVMAAGLGKRMRSKVAKVLHPVAGRPMLLYPVHLAQRFARDAVAVVVGHQAKSVRALLEAQGLQPPVMVVDQAQQRGTGHAVLLTRSAFTRRRGGPPGTYVILNGDTPLLQDATLRDLLRLHAAQRATVTILTAVLADPTGYGRVVRERPGTSEGRVLEIIEDRDARGSEASLREINVGTYAVDGAFLFEALDKLQPRNAQREYYLTDIVALAVERGLRVSALTLQNPKEGLGINSRQHLAAAEGLLRKRICDQWMAAGVTMRDPSSAVIDVDVKIGRDTVLHRDVTLEGRTTLGEDCVIRSGTRITESLLGSRVVVEDCCVIRESHLHDDTRIGPFAHLRPGSVVRRSAKVGNFVEMKKADLGEGSKANHLSYLGDSRIGERVNIGAGTITCNYDGAHKHETVIGDEVFVGSDTQFIAPVKVGRGAIIAAGSTISQEVPANSLAIARAPQVNRDGWASRRRALVDRNAPASKKRAGARKKSGRRKAGRKLSMRG
ncbi:MAG: bifunctional UDP-N-acetylglucosamine diphosphorylase/glucosamine-1-phosphate N-acetyltransferase GlmU [Nitrospiraceae bacterium]